MLTNQSRDLANHHFLAIISCMKILLSVFLLLIATSIEARMYQWINPTTGRTQLSGKAPAWYRSDMGGPRVLVFENNVLVDDTAVAVNEEQRLQLRAQALPLQSSEKGLSKEEAIATLEEQIQAIVDSPEMQVYLKTTPSQTNQTTTQVIEDKLSNSAIKDATDQAGKNNQESTANESSDERVERLKALISAWDKSKTEEAKSLLESKMQTTEDQKKDSDK